MTIEPICSQAENSWALPKLNTINPQQSLILLFGASHLIENSQIFDELKHLYEGIPLVGCSTSGEIIASRIQDNSLVGAILQFDTTFIKLASSSVDSPSESYEAGRSIAMQLQAPELRGILVLSDGLLINGSELVRGLNTDINPDVVITGGLAGDGDRFKRTWVLKNHQPHSGLVTAVGFYGSNIHIGHGTKGGWDIFGPLRRVTKSQENRLYELDGKPALHLYKEYLGEQAAGLPATGLLFPLALRKEPTDTKKLVRTILAVDEKTQSLTFAGDIPEGYYVQMMQANFDRLIAGASDAALMTQQTSNSKGPILSIAISCVGRRLVLGERSEEEIESTLEVFPPETHQIGFYSYGELSPHTNGTCDLHNQTMTLTTISES